MSGDLQLEALLRCPPCNATPFKLYRRRNRQPSGQPLDSYESVLWPTSADVAPPADSARLVCPSCGTALVRVAA